MPLENLGVKGHDLYRKKNITSKAYCKRYLCIEKTVIVRKRKTGVQDTNMRKVSPKTSKEVQRFLFND